MADCDADHVHVPPGHKNYDGFRVTDLWAFCAIDPADDQEGVLGHPDLGPMWASDKRRLESLKPIVERMAERHKIDVTIKHFTFSDEEPL